jgi:ElaB/YqjD/DUF883 family membrane-anchored ribosome-binding protein
MKTHHADSKENASVAEQTKALLAATEHATEETIVEARNRVRVALEATGEACARVKAKAIEGAKVTDKYVRQNPYQAVGIAFGLGALAGFLLSRRSGRD